MSKFLKILIAVFLTLFAGVGFAIPCFSNAQAEESVYVCPSATSLEEINPRCSEKIILKLGETVGGLTLIATIYENQEYYLVLGFENGGGAFNLPPIADADGPYEGYGGLPITFDGSNSSDPNNDPLQYRWDFNSDGIWDTDWLSAPTVSHIWNNNYEGIIKLEVSDGEFNSIATTSIKVISSKILKQDAVSELEKVKTGDKKIDEKINKIIWLINQSLDDNLWIDASHLVFFEKGKCEKLKLEETLEADEIDLDKIGTERQKSGISVFHYEKVAVRLMMNEIKFKKNSDELKNVFEKAIAKLVKTDTLLDKVSIYDAKNTPIKNPKFQKIVEKQIEKAEKEMEKANKELEKGRPDKAIMRLAKSWLHAQLASRYAIFLGEKNCFGETRYAPYRGTGTAQQWDD